MKSYRNTSQLSIRLSPLAMNNLFPFPGNWALSNWLEQTHTQPYYITSYGPFIHYSFFFFLRGTETLIVSSQFCLLHEICFLEAQAAEENWCARFEANSDHTAQHQGEVQKKNSRSERRKRQLWLCYQLNQLENPVAKLELALILFFFSV